MSCKIEHIKSSGFYIITFFVSLFYFGTAFSLGPPIDNGSIEPSFFPLVLGACATIFSGLVLRNNIKKNTLTQQTSPRKTLTDIGDRKVWLVVFITAIYITLFSIIGYFLSSILYVFSIIALFSGNKDALLSKLLISIVIVVIGYLIFEQLFSIRLPTLEV
ncbi:tripartite tricarboxylate transporter TctB family protein [Vibrio sp. MA40-2]|uniref:tripartite tricarboxylate transporter TctB family protein n=1 Tax=Vibrio sp. MA40-2 TaxID=3391828 RepID=UPI0039A48515